jgi:Ca2+-binding RTX toxin-like protein
MSRALAIVVAAAFVLLAHSAGASAATVSAAGGTITYEALGGEDNSLVVSDDGLNYAFTDPAGVAPGLGCMDDVAVNPNVAVCAKAGTTLVTIRLADLDDDTTLDAIDFIGFLQRGGAGADILRGSTGSASSTLIGDEGTDTYVNGPGFDAVGYSDRSTPLTASLDDQPNDPDGENVPAAMDGLSGGGGDDVVNGGPSGDFLGGGGGNDTVNGLGSGDSVFGNEGDDTLNGGGSDDILQGGEGNDSFNGGSGLDIADYADKATAATVTLDDAANDGVAGEADNVRLDVEDAVGSPSADVLTGNEKANSLLGMGGSDSISGGDGEDDVAGGPGDDTINVRDGFADDVSCGTGTDTVNADQLDRVQSGCNTVNRVNVPVARDVPEDRAPLIAFATPAANALLPASPPSTVSVVASDDRAVTGVVLMDDGRVVGTDDAAPYDFAYAPRGEDVGSNTLHATVVDSAGQTATAVVEVRVDRFRPGMRAIVRPTRDRRRPFSFRVAGSVVPPARAGAALGCAEGAVVVRLRRGARTVARRRARLSPSCRYAARLTYRGRRARLRANAAFLGNDVLKRRSARSVAVRAG